MGSKSSSDDRETDEEGSRRRLAGAYRRSARRRRRSPFRVAVAAAAGRSGCWGFRGGLGRANMQRTPCVSWK
jgi:hypothetical protein